MIQIIRKKLNFLFVQNFLNRICFRLHRPESRIICSQSKFEMTDFVLNQVDSDKTLPQSYIHVDCFDL